MKMKAIVKISTGTEVKEVVLTDFKSIYVYDKNIEIKGVDTFGIETSVRVPKENIESINIL